MSGETTLYERLGGEEAIEAVVDEFYERVLADNQLAHFFEDVDMDALQTHQTVFLSAVAGGPVDYSGDDMHEAHRHLNVTHQAFGAVATHLEESLQEFDVPETEIDEVLNAVASLEDDIVTA